MQKFIDGQAKTHTEIGKKFVEVNNKMENLYNELDGRITNLASV